MPSAGLIPTQGGGDGVMQQYQEIIDIVIETFLSIT